MIVEVESSENCEAGCFVRFKDIGPPRPILQVKLYDRNPAGEWYWVTGWSDDAPARTCPAYGRVVEDSGAGLAYLVTGGLYGLRFKPLGRSEEWDLDSPHQWGEAYLLLADVADIRYAD